MPPGPRRRPLLPAAMTVQPERDPNLVGSAAAPAPAPALDVAYVRADSVDALLAEQGTLAVLGFGAAAAHHEDPRYLHVPLQSHGPALQEVWRTSGTVRHGRHGRIAWAHDGRLGFGAIEVEEAGVDIEGAAAAAYAELQAFLRTSPTPHLLRTWNQIDAITLGDQDDERYRRFCVGRVRGMETLDVASLPAATAVGRRDGVRTLQVYWLAAHQPGMPVENPRQVSAWRYPRQYGPQSPSFARAMLPPADMRAPLLLSGTAAIVGHLSRHEGELLAQLDEIFANFEALLSAARTQRPTLPARLGPASRLKVYVRDLADLPVVERALHARLGDQVPRILLHASVCRQELSVEIEGLHG